MKENAMGYQWIVGHEETVLVTGAAGFIGSRVVDSLLRRGFKHVRCFVRPSSDLELLNQVLSRHGKEHCEVISGNLLSRADCMRSAEDVAVAFHLVTGRGKSFPGCFQNSVVTTRNLLDALVKSRHLKRFVNVSSYAVYSNQNLKSGAVLDETCPLEDNIEDRFDAYVWSKLGQDKLVEEYNRIHGVPYVTVRPGFVIGPGKQSIPGLVGIDTFGVFLHLAGRRQVPITYVENCADAIALAGLVRGVDGQVFNVVDDDLPTSRSFLRQYKDQVRSFRTVPVPYSLFYVFCFLWERYSRFSDGQLPPVFNRRSCAFYWRGLRFSNRKLKNNLGWKPEVPMDEALSRYFQYQKNGKI
jgi:nucleoside-diphosphate-sugar epimerase